MSAMRKFLPLLGLLLSGVVSLHAQTTYTLIGTNQCGPQTSTTITCSSILYPSNLLSDSVIRFYGVPFQQDTDNTGYVSFENTAGQPGKYVLGAGVDSTTVIASNSILLNITGVYAPASGGAVFTGTVVVNWRYATVKCGYHLRQSCPIIEVVGGTLTINN